MIIIAFTLLALTVFLIGCCIASFFIGENPQGKRTAIIITGVVCTVVSGAAILAVYYQQFSVAVLSPAVTPINQQIGNVQNTEFHLESSPEEPSNVEESATESENVNAKPTTLYAGTFYVGTDINPGRYVFTCKGSGNFVIYSQNDDLLANEILTDGSNDFSLGVPSVTITLSENDKIEISGIESVKCSPVDRKLSTSLSTGCWTVGLDISADTYDATSAKKGQSGNFIVHSSEYSLKVNEILGDDELGLGVTKIRVELVEGDLIQISGLERVAFKRPK